MGSVAVPSGYLSYVEWYELYGRTSSFELGIFIRSIFRKPYFCVENNLPQKIIGGLHPKFNFLLTPNIIFVLFESARRINCFLIRLFKLISIWWRPPPIKSANQGGAWIWKPSWLYSDASYIAAFLSCWYRHNTWSINIHQTIYLSLLAILFWSPYTLL